MGSGFKLGLEQGLHAVLPAIRWTFFCSYPLFVPSIQRLRERMPLIAFILLFVMLVMLIAVACACATEHPMKAVDRMLSAASAIPAVIEVWTYTFAALLFVPFLVPPKRRALGRASPQELQRFLF
jgi:hypothetical protein